MDMNLPSPDKTPDETQGSVLVADHPMTPTFLDHFFNYMKID